MKKEYYFEHYPINNDNKKIVCVLTGADGGINWSRQIAKQFNKQHYSSCAIAYWKYKKLKKEISNISLEIIEEIVEYLKQLGYEKVYLYGLSKGAEMCLLYSSLFNNIDGVIAISPSCCILEGFSYKGYSNQSSWTYNNQEFEYLSFKNKRFKLFKTLFYKENSYLKSQFENTFKVGYYENNRIKIENATCPIILMSCKNDSIWPSSMMCDLMMDTLYNMDYKYDNEHISYDYASHVISPIKSFKLKVFKSERLHKKTCDNIRRDAFITVIQWLNNLDS